MNTAPPPVVVQQKRGMGCFGIGCVVLFIAVLLICGLVAGLGYLSYAKVGSMTSTSPANVPTFDGGNDVYQGAEKKVSDFQQAIQENHPATLELTADEINTMIARNPELSNPQVHIFTSMAGDQMHVQTSFSSNLIPLGLIKDKFINADAAIALSVDPSTRTLTINFRTLKVGSEEMTGSQLVPLQAEINSTVNMQLQRQPDTQILLEHAQSMEVKDGKLEIASQ